MLLSVLLFGTSLLLSGAEKVPNSLWNFNSMVKCRLQYSGYVYNNYGCYCGLGGKGEPVDGIDECCRDHDRCYIDITTCGKRLGKLRRYTAYYKWECNDHVPKCKEDNNECAMATCECDRKAVECWANYTKPTHKPKCPS
ncbi:hypothetical protein AB6A40_003190 [Gnathostoma spinigerum]|uniref:Phospholipase A2 n=1 Tax=Gnathostoma spinigerum TaxID=75299 RepID=A0ABD6EGG6_9BILA